MEVRIAGNSEGERVNRRECSGSTLAAKRRPEIERVGEHTFRVPSRTTTGRVYTVDIDNNYCTCKDAQINKAICAHQWAAAAVMMELQAEPEYVIEKYADSRAYSDGGYRLVEYRGGERVSIIGERSSWIDCFMDRVELERAA